MRSRARHRHPLDLGAVTVPLGSERLLSFRAVPRPYILVADAPSKRVVRNRLVLVLEGFGYDVLGFPQKLLLGKRTGLVRGTRPGTALRLLLQLIVRERVLHFLQSARVSR